jgi:hypothetical protein
MTYLDETKNRGNIFCNHPLNKLSFHASFEFTIGLNLKCECGLEQEYKLTN